MEVERVAHDLAILYMQLEIKEETIRSSTPDDLQGFADEYQSLYAKFRDIIER